MMIDDEDKVFVVVVVVIVVVGGGGTCFDSCDAADRSFSQQISVTTTDTTSTEGYEL
jgi:hypothetical protein